MEQRLEYLKNIYLNCNNNIEYFKFYNYLSVNNQINSHNIDNNCYIELHTIDSYST